MKIALAFVVFRLPFGAPLDRPPEDPWFGRDKAKHFAVAALMQATTHALGRSAGLDYRAAAWTAAGVTLSAGVAKELQDRAAGRFFSWRDVGADVAGVSAAAVLVRQARR